MTKNNDKCHMALNLLALSMESDYIAKHELKKYTDEIDLLNRKRNSLLNDKIKLEKQVGQLKLTPSRIRFNKDSMLKKANILFQEGNYREAKERYLELLELNEFYSFLKINVKICDDYIKKVNK